MEVFGSDELVLEFAEFEAGTLFSFKKAVVPSLTSSGSVCLKTG